VNYSFGLSEGRNGEFQKLQKGFAFSVTKRRRLMGDEKSSMAITTRDRDRELLIPVADTAAVSLSPKPSSSSSAHHAGREVISSFTLSHLGFSILHCNSFSFPLFYPIRSTWTVLNVLGWGIYFKVYTLTWIEFFRDEAVRHWGVNSFLLRAVCGF